MIPCELVSSELWDWLRCPADHPDDVEIRGHLMACASCRTSAERIADLRTCLPGLRDSPDPGFEQDLASRLAALRQGGVDPAAGRFAPDPLLEADGEVGRPGVVVDRRHRSWWARPVALVATGAVAALVVGLLGRWAGPAEPEPGRLAATDPSRPVVEEDSQAVAPAAPEEYGILAERSWEDDSSAAASRRPDRQDHLTPVTTLP